MTTRQVTEFEEELLDEVRSLGLLMIRFDEWAREAGLRGRWLRVYEFLELRDQAGVRRSSAMRELWDFRRR